jgi:hypothetical protein
MSEHAFFEYRAKLISTPHVEVFEEQGEPVHCLIKFEIGALAMDSQSFLSRKLGI